MTNRTRSATLVGAACLVALAGCGSDSKPKVLPSLSSTPAATSATASPDSVEAQVEAAVRHYFAEANRALATGNTATLESLSTPGCGCRTLVDFVKETYRKGNHPDHAKFIVHSISIHDVRADTAGALVTVEVPAYNDLNSSGHMVQSYQAHKGRQDLSFAKLEGFWLVVNGVRLD